MKGNVVKKIWFILVCIISIGIISLCGIKLKEKELENWLGEYIYVETFPRNDGEQNYYICFQTTIYEENKTFYARIECHGWFIQTDILASVNGNRNKITLTYLDILPNDGLYGCGGRYQFGEKLFELETDGHEIITIWKEFRQEHPIFIENNNEIRGIYFQKIDD